LMFSVNCEEKKQSRMRENFMSGIDEGRLDKQMSEACLLLTSVIIDKMKL
jgi:translation elongation factor EF-Ts